ncbi:MAG: pyridoxal phosphate-dependent aminotransferase [Vicinamibacterales bacterium]
MPTDIAPNRVTLALAGLAAAGVEIVDLTQSNPTDAGIEYPSDLLSALSTPASMKYEPQPFGLDAARQAVSDDFSRRGRLVPPARIVLTASTSEAYSLLFKILCDPGEQVLVPRPSYPLFEHLARLDSVVASPYVLDYHGGWRVDMESVRAALTPATRALVIVSPNNPTGSCLHPEDLSELSRLACDRGFAIIGDEVFADYPMEDGRCWPSVLDAEGVLAFSLGGLSKSVGLPQLKLGWIAAAGPDPQVGEALARLEIACDAYLSVSTPVQHASGKLLSAGAAVRSAILTRVRDNHRVLSVAVSRYPACRLLPVEAGWYAVLQVPARRTEEETVISLLCEEHVLVHPGYFFDFPREAFLVTSLLPPQDRFETAVERLLMHVS